ncbi:hypothetical protein [Ralstonia phage RSF1]|uniref:Uncharacterized protein n=1 Tax=Ralstonia phage RSF1 TaxID=1689679 RepID=A0A0K2QQU8_9CAUD|nr:hypothetical protein AVU11_gp165 [Ralstonia phage RSF1]BAS04957.1 hypothetical protein [Ralstonia phage RSF1]
MRKARYLLGDRYEKKRIGRLLIEEQPIFIEYDYIELCEELVERLQGEMVRNGDDFDYVLCNFLDDVEIDIKERLGKLPADVMPYLLRVEEAMQYFKKYLEQISCIPLPDYLIVKPGTYLSVMEIRV